MRKATYRSKQQIIVRNEKDAINFISKNFQGTIQNDNLPKGKIWETWFQKPLNENRHLMANGYANSWVIDADEICGGLIPAYVGMTIN